MRSTVLWNAMPASLAESNGSFRGPSTFYDKVDAKEKQRSGMCMAKEVTLPLLKLNKQFHASEGPKLSARSSL
jgi:hypothetical protein